MSIPRSFGDVNGGRVARCSVRDAGPGKKEQLLLGTENLLLIQRIVQDRSDGIVIQPWSRSMKQLFSVFSILSAILLISNSECRGQGPLVVITDLDNSGGPFVCSSETCTWTSGEFSIAGASEYVLSADIECIGIDLFEEDDYLTISYRIDNGSWIPLMELYDDFRRTTFTTSVTGSGLSMQLKIDSETSSSTETFVVHKLMVETAAGSTFPSFPPDTGIDPECGMQASAGTLIIDGGSLERVPTHPTIMAMIEHMGGLETHIVASYQGQSEVTPAEYAEYTGYWVDIGFETVSTMTSDEHDMVESNTEAFVADLKLATGLFMRGGRQWRIVDTFGNADVSTLTLDEMWNLLERGGVIGGTSAGATVQGDFMPRGDTGGSGTMISEEPLHQQGFRFLPNVAFDVHVSARGRITDLKEVMEYTNARDDDIIGIGIDEDTAIVVQGKVFEVIGSGVVYVHTWSESVEGGYILILKAGDKYNLCTRQEFVAALGDLDGDGFVDGKDLLKWQRDYTGSAEDATDLANWEANYGKSVAAQFDVLSAVTSAVPEPTTCTLALAALCLAMSRRRAF